jgi:hypothetical protein
LPITGALPDLLLEKKTIDAKGLRELLPASQARAAASH